MLRSRAAGAIDELRKHRKICANCHPDDNWPHRACEAGWKLAKAATRAANDLDVFKGTASDAEIGGQGVLFRL